MESLAETFADLEPIEQDDGPVAVVRIDYSESFSKVMGYFRRILVNEEYSKRALTLAAGEHLSRPFLIAVWPC
jgi:protein farnesyltransferase/geranylgeranyltransferase type-1 subunit alpha